MDNLEKRIYELVEEYLKDNPDVKMYYVLPPRAKVSEWLLNQHNNYETIVSSGGATQVSSLIGNQFIKKTVYFFHKKI
jgi:hypothetical protein